MEKFPEPALNSIYQNLGVGDLIALQRTSKFLSESLLNNHPLIQELHQICSIYRKQKKSNRFYKWYAKYYQSPWSVIRVMLWYFGGFIFFFPIHLGCCMTILWVMSIFTCNLDICGYMLSLIVKSYVALPLIFKELKKGETCANTDIPSKSTGYSSFNAGYNLYCNIIWLLCGGLILSAIHFVLGLIQFATIVGAPNGYTHMQFAKVYLYPFGYSIHCLSPFIPADTRPLLIRGAVRRFMGNEKNDDTTSIDVAID